MPDLLNGPRPIPTAIHQWLGRAHALIAATGDSQDAVSFKAAIPHLGATVGRSQAVQNIISIIYRALATAELHAPASAQGAFIPAGNAFDALAAVAKVFGTASKDLLLIDPYMDEKALTDFAPLAPENVAIRLLADQQSHKPSLRPAAQRWVAQHGSLRPLEAKLAPPRTLHDRLIIADSASVWVLTQSLNAFASRAPASIVKVDAETATLKINAYDTMWANGTPL